MAYDVIRDARGAPEPEDYPALQYFQAVAQAYLGAESRAGGRVTRSYCIAGYTIRVNFAGSACVPYVNPALAHLAVEPPATPDLTVSVWDSASTDIQLPDIPWKMRDQSPRGSIYGYNTARMRTAFHGEHDAVSLMDRGTESALYWVRSAEDIDQGDVAAPLRTIFHWFLSSMDCQVVHAGGIGTEHAGIVLVGKGGSGKSTTCLSCLHYGFHYVGEDYVAISTRPSPRAWSLYNSAKLNADSLERLPHLVPLVRNRQRAESDKALVFLRDLYREQPVPSLPINAVVVPRVTGEGPSRLLKASRAVGLGALAPSSIFQLPDADESAFKSMVDLARQVPCYTLQIGRESANVPDLIAQLLRDLESQKGLRSIDSAH
jgi:hypothetical protein